MGFKITVAIFTLVATVLAEPPSSYLNYHQAPQRAHGVVYQNTNRVPTPNVEMVKSHAVRTLQTRQVVQPIQGVPQFPAAQFNAKPVRQNAQKKGLTQQKFRRAPQAVPAQQQVQQVRYQKKPVQNVRPATVRAAPQKNTGARVVKSPNPAQFQQPKLNIHGIQLVPQKVYREAPYSTLTQANEAVPSSQHGGYSYEEPAAALNHGESSGSSSAGAQGGYDSNAQSQSGAGSGYANNAQTQGLHPEGAYSAGSSDGAAAGGSDEGYGYEQPQQGFADGDYSGAGQAFESSQEFMQNVEAALDENFSFVAQDVGENSQEGLKIDENLLELIRDVLIEEENINTLGPIEAAAAAAGGGAGGAEGKPFPVYGPPSAQPPSSANENESNSPNRIVEVVLDDAIPSIQVAQYLGMSSKFAEQASQSDAAAPEIHDGYRHKHRFF